MLTLQLGCASALLSERRHVVPVALVSVAVQADEAIAGVVSVVLQGNPFYK